MSESLSGRDTLLQEIARLKQRVSELELRDEGLKTARVDAPHQIPAAGLQVPFVVLSTDGRLLRWSQSFARLVDAHDDELQTTRAARFFKDGTAFQKLVEKAAEEGRCDGTVRLARRETPARPFTVSLERVETGEEVCVLCVMCDARQKERIEAIHQAGTEARDRVTKLSRRQRQVFDLVVDGMANKNIAIQLGISEKTVEMHRSQVMRKMQAANMAALVRLAVLAELADHDHPLTDN